MPEWTEKDFESYTQSDWELIKTVKQLADENLDNVKILTRANDIALAIFGMLCVRLRDNGEEGADGLGMSLQEYTGTMLDNAKRKKEEPVAHGSAFAAVLRAGVNLSRKPL